MILIWHFYWPALVAATVIGVIAGRIGFFRPKLKDDAPDAQKTALEDACKKRRRKAMLLGIACAMVAVGLWHWPAGSGARFASMVERIVAQEIQRLEMPEIKARLAREPLRRTLILSGPANDLQQAEFVRIMETAPGVAGARWNGQPGRRVELPIIGEVALLSLLSFLAGLLLAYFIEIRRRVNAEWSW